MQTKENEIEETFDGEWYAHPPMRNLLIAGLFIGTAFGLAHLGFIFSKEAI